MVNNYKVRFMDSNVVYDCRWSTEADEKYVSEYISVIEQVFQISMDRGSFNRQYFDNIYGPSILCLTYIDGKPSATEGLWRNDINGKVAYQSGGSAVLPICRGKGVFKEMVKRVVEKTRPEDIVYGFPNINSYPAFMKFGWKEPAYYHLCILTSNKEYRRLHPYDMDEQYFNYWVKGKKDFYHIRKGSMYYLVAKYGRPFCYLVFASVPYEIAKQYPRLKKLGVIFYRGDKETFYNKRFIGSHVITFKEETEYIPTWKVDSI